MATVDADVYGYSSDQSGPTTTPALAAAARAAIEHRLASKASAAGRNEDRSAIFYGPLGNSKASGLLARIVGTMGPIVAFVLTLSACGNGKSSGVPSRDSAATDIEAPSARWEQIVQLIDDFSWRLQPRSQGDGGTGEELGYRFYSRLAADRGEMGQGSADFGVIIEDGEARIRASTGANGTSWAGLWYSLAGTAVERSRALDPQRALPWPIRDEVQARIGGWRLRVKGQGRFKVELKDGEGRLIMGWADLRPDSSSAFSSVQRPTPQLAPGVKLLNLIVDSPAMLTFDDIALDVEMRADLDELRRTFVLAHAQLLRGYDHASGRTGDHAQWPAGRFDSVPGFGFQALAAAAAWDLGYVAFEDARAVAAKSIHGLLQSPRKQGWLPHWLRNGERHPDSEWSTVDTALAFISALQAAIILELRSELAELQAAVSSLDFAGVTDGTGAISHGFDSRQGERILSSWRDWGGETALLVVLRGYQNPSLPDLVYERRPPAYCGRGFITELGALFFRELGGGPGGRDKWGVDWHEERLDHLQAQRAAGVGDVYGLSPGEVISRDGATAYLEGGTGVSERCARKDALAGFEGPWYMPHYVSMSAALDLPTSRRTLRMFRELGLIPPLGGPAEAALMEAGPKVARWHSVQASLNAFFHVIGLYHAVAAAEARRDVIYQTVSADSRLGKAIAQLVPQP